MSLSRLHEREQLTFSKSRGGGGGGGGVLPEGDSGKLLETF